MSSIPDRVLSLIEQSGMTRSDFAQQLRLTEHQLAESLSGSRGFSAVEVARIAQTCEVSVKWLITGTEPPLAVAGRMTTGRAAEAVAVARQYVARRTDLARLGYPQPWRPMTARLGGGTYADQGESLARTALVEVVNEGRSVAEDDLPVLIEDVFGIDLAVSELGDGFDGLAAVAEDAKLILLATTSNSARQRFTLAHELGHILAGDDQEVHLDRDVFEASRKKDPSEQRANAFASHFLMPETVLRNALQGKGLTQTDHANLACDLMVTPAALAYRLQRLRIIDAGMCDRYKRMTARGAAEIAGRSAEFEQRAIESGKHRLPGLLVRDTYAAYEAGHTTLRPYATLLGVDVDELRRELEDNHAIGGGQ